MDGHRLREVEDFLGRKLNFQYDSFGNLLAVVTPSITRAAEGNTFPGGTAYVFEYDGGNLTRVYYPNQVEPFLDTEDRTVDVASVYAQATPRYVVAYDADNRVESETVGDPVAGVGGTYTYSYETGLSIESIFYDSLDPKPQDIIVSRTTMIDRNGNESVYEFNDQGQAVRVEVLANRGKNSLQASSYVTHTRYNAANQPIVKIMPEGNSIEYTYDDGMLDLGSGSELYNKRRGLLAAETQKPGNDFSIPSRAGSNGQTELTRQYFYDPIFNSQTAVIERRGNPIDAPSTFFTPQNGGTTPTSSNRSRYATYTFFDYQQNDETTISTDSELQALLGLSASEIVELISEVNQQLVDGGLPDGFDINLGDINGDGTGNGTPTSSLPASPMSGNVVKIKHPDVRLIPATGSIATQERIEIFTVNARGQVTTHTDPEGNLTVNVYYAFSDPEGDGQFINTDLADPTLMNKQYGRLKEVHVDADPDDVMSLVGEDGDLADFAVKLTRTNTPDVYQDLVTRHERDVFLANGTVLPSGRTVTHTGGGLETNTTDNDHTGTVTLTSGGQSYVLTRTVYDASDRVVDQVEDNAGYGR